MPRGKGRHAPPLGFITPTEASQRLGPNRLYKMVKTNRLHRYTPPDQTHGFYSEQEVNAILEAEQVFYGALREDTTVSATFALATPGDMASLYKLAMRLFPNGTISAEQRREWIRKESRGHYVVKRDDNGDVVAYLYILAPALHDKLLAYMRGQIGAINFTADDIRRLEPGEPLDLIIGGIGRSADIEDKENYASVLLRGIMHDLERWGQEGIIIHKLYAYSETFEGVQMCLKLGMQQWAPPTKRKGQDRFTFVLDVAESDSFLLRGYKRTLQAWQQVRVTEPATPAQERADLVRAEPATAPFPTPQRRTRAAAGAHAVTHGELPAGSLSIQDFAKQLGITRRTLYEQVVKNDLPHIALPNPNRPGDHARFFSPAQQKEVKDWRASRGR